MRFKDFVFIDMDGVLCDFNGRVADVLGKPLTDIPEDQRETIVDQCMDQPGFFIHMDPMPGAIEAYHQLMRRYQVYLLSTASWGHPHSWSEKRIWVENHLKEHGKKRLILCHNKGLFSGRALIDDRDKHGVPDFAGEHIHFGTQQFPDWEAVTKYLL